MKKNRVKGAKTTEANTKYICVSQYGKKSDKADAFSVIVMDSKNHEPVDEMALFREENSSNEEYLKFLNEVVDFFVAKYKCRAVINPIVQPLKLDQKGNLIAEIIPLLYFSYAMLQESMK
jgi:hypothetical protein